MSKEKLDFTRTTKPASDRELDIAALEILDRLKDFKSPKDAASAFALAHFAMIKACFPPEYRKEAIKAIEAHGELIKDLIEEGYQ